MKSGLKKETEKKEKDEKWFWRGLTRSAGALKSEYTRGRKIAAQTKNRYPPCLKVAEFLGNDFADIDAESVDNPLGQVRVRRAAEDLDVRHPALQQPNASIV